MVTSILPRLPMTKKVRQALTDGLGEGMPVGLAAIPTAPDPEDPQRLIPVEAPYAIVYPLWRNLSGPGMTHPEADAEWVYQVSAYAKKGDQLEWMLDRILAVMIGRNPDGSFQTPLEVDGMFVMDRELKDDSGSELGNNGPSGLLSSDLRFGLFVTPVT